MREFFRDLGIVLSGLCLACGIYLLHEALSSQGRDAPGALILGSVLCALALVMGFSSIRLHYSLREWKRHAEGNRQ